MSTIAHEIILHYLNDDDKLKLKIICQDWTKLSESLYVIHHSEELELECPVCESIKRRFV